jgi:GTP cyclohydrolase I
MNMPLTAIPNLIPTASANIYFNTASMKFYVFDEAGLEHCQADSFVEAVAALDEYQDALDGVFAPRHVVRKATLEILQAVEPGNRNGLREGLLDTPTRVAKAWAHWAGGYSIDIAGLLKVFEDGAEGYDQMVIVKDIPIYSKCEHHLADIFGTATIAYIPNGKVVGLSKLSRVADAFARRLQVQERLTNQIADALHEHLQPIGVGVVIKARHMCMESRGLCQQGHHTITSALRGAIKDEPQVRAEFLQLAQ